MLVGMFHVVRDGGSGGDDGSGGCGGGDGGSGGCGGGDGGDGGGDGGGGGDGDVAGIAHTVVFPYK